MLGYCIKVIFFFFQAEDGIRDLTVTGVQTCALPISGPGLPRPERRHERRGEPIQPPAERAQVRSGPRRQLPGFRWSVDQRIGSDRRTSVQSARGAESANAPAAEDGQATDQLKR